MNYEKVIGGFIGNPGDKLLLQSKMGVQGRKPGTRHMRGRGNAKLRGAIHENRRKAGKDVGVWEGSQRH